MSNMNRLAMSKFLVSKFLEEHPDYYDSYEIDFLKRSNSSLFKLFTGDVSREIYDELDLIPDEYNMYLAFLDLLEEKFGIEDKNIVEVGRGIIPRLAKRINMKQKNGTITVYDPRLGSDIHGNERLILKREKFDRGTIIDADTDLIIGLMPCKGAEYLIEQAGNNGIDFMLWLCEGGPHGDIFDFYESDEEWLDSMMYYAKSKVENNKMGKLMVKRIDELSDYPIIYNERQK